MHAMIIETFGSTDQLKMVDLPTPEPLEDEVQIRVVDAGVNPVDWKICEGKLQGFMPHEFPLILGFDAAGIVTKVGKNVRDFEIGDEVFADCGKPVVKWGAYAEYVCVGAKGVALKPKKCSFAQAAALPIASLTAWQALFDHARLKRGQTILIHAGAGGVGGMAIELAKWKGARVLTTASTANHLYVKDLGAEAAIDYQKEDIVAKIKALAPEGVDVVLDTVGGQTLRDSLLLVKPKGVVVSIVENLELAEIKAHKIKFHHFFCRPDGKQLDKIAELIDDGQIVPPPVEEIPFEEARRALDKSRAMHTRGKIVLKMS